MTYTLKSILKKLNCIDSYIISSKILDKILQFIIFEITVTDMGVLIYKEGLGEIVVAGLDVSVI